MFVVKDKYIVIVIVLDRSGRLDQSFSHSFVSRRGGRCAVHRAMAALAAMGA